MTDISGGLGLGFDTSPLLDLNRALAGVSDQAQRLGSAVLAQAGNFEQANQALNDFEKTLGNIGRQNAGQAIDELRQRLVQLRQDAAESVRSVQEVQSSWSNLRFPGGPAPSLPGLGGVPGAGASGYQAQAGGAGAYPGGSVQPTSIAAFQAANQALAQSADRAQTAVAGLGGGLRQYQTQADAAQNVTTSLGRSVQTFLSAAGVGSGSFAGTALGYITGRLAVEGIEATVEAVGHLTRSVIENGEAWQLAQQRIETSLHLTAEQADETRQRLVDQSRGTSFQSAVQTTQFIGPSLQERGYGVRDITDITRALQELTVISGTAPARAQRAIFELSESFATGKVSGQQFRTMVIDMPPLLQALAESAGTTQGKLVEMAHEGLLTPQFVAQGLLNVLPQLDQQFNSVGNTVSRAEQDIANAWQETSGKASQHAGMIQAVAGAYESLADFLRGGVIQSLLTEIAKTIAATAHDVQNVIDLANKLQGAFTAQPNDPGTIEGRLARANQERARGEQLRETPDQQETPAEIADRFSGPSDRANIAQGVRDAATAAGQHSTAEGLTEQAEAADRAASAWTALAAAQAQAEAYQRDARPGPVTDEQRQAEQLNKLTDDRIAKLKEEYDLKQRYATLVEKLSDAEQTGEGGPQRIAAMRAEAADEAKQIATLEQNRRVQQYAQDHGVAEDVARKAIQDATNVNATLTERERILQRIKDAQSVAADASVHGDTGEEQAALKTLTSAHQELARYDQQRAEAAARTRESLIGQADALSRYAAEEDKLARAEHRGPQGEPAALTKPGDIALAEQGAQKRLFEGVEQEAEKANAGATQLQRVDAQIAAVQQVISQHTETRRLGEAEINRLTVERGRLLSTEQGKIDEIVRADSARLEKLRLQVDRGTTGRGDIQDRIDQAGEAAASQYKLLTPEEADVDPGSDIKIRSMREQAQAYGALKERQDVEREAIRSLGDPTLAYTEQLHKLQDELTAGVITYDQYTAAARRAYVQSQQAVVQQRKTDDLNKGDPFTTTSSFGEQVRSGADAAGLDFIERYGNAAKDAQEATTQLGQAGLDVFDQWAHGATIAVDKIVQDLAIMVEKQLLALAVARLLGAALGIGAGPTPAIGANASAASAGYVPQASSEGVSTTVYHGGGEAGLAAAGRMGIDPQVVEKAPRYHAGTGEVRPDEEVAVLQSGERVLNRQETRDYGARPPDRTPELISAIRDIAKGPAAPVRPEREWTPPRGAASAGRQDGPARSAVVNIHPTVVNNAGGNVTAGVEARQRPNGDVDLMVTLEQATNALAAAGRLDRGLSARYDLDRRLR